MNMFINNAIMAAYTAEDLNPFITTSPDPTLIERGLEKVGYFIEIIGLLFGGGLTIGLGLLVIGACISFIVWAVSLAFPELKTNMEASSAKYRMQKKLKEAQKRREEEELKKFIQQEKEEEERKLREILALEEIEKAKKEAAAGDKKENNK